MHFTKKLVRMFGNEYENRKGKDWIKTAISYAKITT